MKVIENHCVSCDLPCLGSSCPNASVPVYYCDQCDEEIGTLYRVDDEDLCEECLKERFKVD